MQSKQYVAPTFAPLLLFVLLHLALSVSSHAVPLHSDGHDTVSLSIPMRRRLPPDITINILFSVLSAFLAIITMVQAAYLARAYFRTNTSNTALNGASIDPEDQVTSRNVHLDNLSDAVARESINDDPVSSSALADPALGM